MGLVNNYLHAESRDLSGINAKCATSRRGVTYAGELRARYHLPPTPTQRRK